MSEEKKAAGLFDVEDESSMEFLNKKQRNSDGIYRPSLEEAKDKRVGYKATFRFLKNLKKDGKMGAAAIEKHLHYVKLKNHQDLMGYYDCKKNIEPDCPLCSTYWALSKSKNAADQEKAEMLKRNTKYYSYVLIIEDENHKELEGKIMVFSYGYKIKEKIAAQYNGEVDGKICNVFDPANGKDFRLIIKENKTPEGTFPNYDSSQFLEMSPLKINGKTLPVTYNEEKKFNVVTDAKVQNFLKDFLLKRDHDIEEYEAKQWEDEMLDKVNKIIAIVSGEDESMFSAKSSIGKTSKESSRQSTQSITESDFDFSGGEKDSSSVDDFFNVDEK